MAILDYMSQSVLFPVHSFLFRVLRTIPQDVTFNQGRFLELVTSWGPNTIYYSIDLSKATDRFPLRLIQFTLTPMFGVE